MTLINRRKTLVISVAGVMALGTLTTALAADKIVVGAMRFTSHSASFIAVEKGYFKQNGLDVELKFFSSAQSMAVAIASGDVDYAVTAMSGGLISLAEKGAIKIIGGALSEEKGIDGQKILVSDKAYKAGVTSPAKLGGKTFGVTTAGSSFHYMGSKIAQAEGVKVKFKPLQKVGTIVGSIKSGQIDAWSIVPHIAKPLAGSGKVHIIGNVADYIPNYQVTTVFTSANNAKNKRDLTQRFLKSFSLGADDFNTVMVDKKKSQGDVDAMVDLIHKYVYADKPRDKAAKSIINGSMRLNKNAALNITSIKDQLQWFQSEKLVSDKITIDTVVDSSYVKTF